MKHMFLRRVALLALCTLILPVAKSDAQGVTTGSVAGVVLDAQGAAIPGASVHRGARCRPAPLMRPRPGPTAASPFRG